VVEAVVAANAAADATANRRVFFSLRYNDTGQSRIYRLF
jgi:hypothetical protein